MTDKKKMITATVYENVICPGQCGGVLRNEPHLNAMFCRTCNLAFKLRTVELEPVAIGDDWHPCPVCTNMTDHPDGGFCSIECQETHELRESLHANQWRHSVD